MGSCIAFDGPCAAAAPVLRGPDDPGAGALDDPAAARRSPGHLVAGRTCRASLEPVYGRGDEFCRLDAVVQAGEPDLTRYQRPPLVRFPGRFPRTGHANSTASVSPQLQLLTIQGCAFHSSDSVGIFFPDRGRGGE